MINDRQDRARFPRPNVPTDKLPPHDEGAEAGVLGCVLLDQSGLKAVMERFGGDKVFFMLPNQRILEAMVDLNREGLAIDLVTVQSRLRDRGELDQIGGVPYLTGLIDATPSAANLPSYLDIVWEKYLARCLVQSSQHQIDTVMEQNGVSEVTLARVKRMQEEFEHKSQRGAVSHQYLKAPLDFEEGFFKRFFGGEVKVPGYVLPIPFVLKIRRQETTLVSGDDGSGKSTLLNYFLLHIASQLAPGERVCVASMEMPPAVTMWILASQLLGRKHLPDSQQGRAAAAAALAWLNERFIFYDFLGIADWRELLLAFRYAVERLGMVAGLIDSVMRVGIPDDDYAQQGMAGTAFAQFAKDQNAHLFTVIHENKGDGKGKAKIRGSKLWSANADNVLRVERNSDKGEKVGKADWRIRNEEAQVKPNQAEIEEQKDELVKLKREWDCRMVLQKQRYPGTDQNASKAFWFDPECFQFRNDPNDVAVNWVDRWKRKHH